LAFVKVNIVDMQKLSLLLKLSWVSACERLEILLFIIISAHTKCVVANTNVCSFEN